MVGQGTPEGGLRTQMVDQGTPKGGVLTTRRWVMGPTCAKALTPRGHHAPRAQSWLGLTKPGPLCSWKSRVWGGLLSWPAEPGG